MTLKKHQNPEGGLNEAGRKYYENKEGGNLRPPVSSGDNSRRVSFAARFAAQNHPMKDEQGKPTRYALALKKWGFSSPAEARAFAKRNKQEA
jgi:hypothetical protein